MLKLFLIHCPFIFFFYQGFLSRTLTTRSTAGEGRGASFIPLYHFQLLTNIETFTCNSGFEMTYIFDSTACLYQTVTLWDLPPYWITIWLIDAMLIFFYLLKDLILGFWYNNLTRENDGRELASTITLVLQTNRLTKYASHRELKAKVAVYRNLS